MDDAEGAFTADGDSFALTGPDAGLLFALRMSDNLASTIRLRLVYRDDAARPAPPERSPGTVPLVGFEGLGVERLAAGGYRFALSIFALGGDQPDTVRRLLAELDAPLAAEVTAAGSG
jgi:hypothetical protein